MGNIIESKGKITSESSEGKKILGNIKNVKEGNEEFNGETKEKSVLSEIKT